MGKQLNFLMLLEVAISKAVSSLPTLSTPIPGQGGNLSYREQDNCMSVRRTMLVGGFFSLTNMCFIELCAFLKMLC